MCYLNTTYRPKTSGMRCETSGIAGLSARQRIRQQSRPDNDMWGAKLREQVNHSQAVQKAYFIETSHWCSVRVQRLTFRLRSQEHAISREGPKKLLERMWIVQKGVNKS